MVAIVAGALVLSWPGEARFAGLWPALTVLGACLAWGVDNTLTRRVSLTDTTWIAAVKGLVAGVVNLIFTLILARRSDEHTSDLQSLMRNSLAGLFLITKKNTTSYTTITLQQHD